MSNAKMGCQQFLNKIVNAFVEAERRLRKLRFHRLLVPVMRAHPHVVKGAHAKTHFHGVLKSAMEQLLILIQRRKFRVR